MRATDMKKLWGRSGNRCSFYGCKQVLAHGKETNRVLGEEAHIKGDKPGKGSKGSSPRYDQIQSQEERDGYENRILLCPTHHTEIDADEELWTVARLLKMKADHERQMEQNQLYPELLDGLEKLVDTYKPREQQDEVLVATIVSQEENKITVQVPAVKEGGINTGVKARRGKTISFFAMGLISYDGGYHFTTPEGILANEFGIPLTKVNDEGKPTYMIWPNEAAYRTDGGIPGRIGSLIGWIGNYDPMKAFVVGTKREFDIDEEGDVYLAVNDAKGTYGDNVGDFRVEITLTESSFDTLTSRGLLTKVKQSDNDAWRNKHRISFLIRPGRKVELDIALAERQEPKDALIVSFTFGGEQYVWDNLITRLKEFVITNKIDWLSFEELGWGDSWSIHGQNLTRYFTQFSLMGWLNREFNPAPTWYSGPRSGTGDPADSSTIEFTLLQP